MKVAIIGSRGFIGHHMVTHLLAETAHSLVLVNRRDAPVAGAEERLTSRRASLLDNDGLVHALADADVVINLAWPSEAGSAAWTHHLANALRAGRARQLIHCSTAVVAGRTAERRVDERTTPEPATPYEAQKLEAEARLGEELAGRIPLVIARPTVVFGPGGQNLVSLATALKRQGPMRNMLRRLLFGERQMHLVPVGTVARALAFLIARDLPTPIVVHMAADDDPENTYPAVERRLRSGLELPPAPASTVALPPAVLRAVLRLRGRSDADPDRRYANHALTGLGFTGSEPVGIAVEAFGRWLASQTHPPC